MRTLLLSLAVVAFVCLGSADQLGLGRQQIDRGRRQAIAVPTYHCYQCNRETSSDCSTAHRCPWETKMCYTLYKLNGNGGEEFSVKGCAKTCPTAGPGERVKCCYTGICNKY